MRFAKARHEEMTALVVRLRKELKAAEKAATKASEECIECQTFLKYGLKVEP